MKMSELADIEGHIQKAKHNSEFLEKFYSDKTQFPDWAVIVMFYEALHYVDAYLSTKGHIRIDDHRQRNELVDKHLKDIAAIYIDLFYKESRKARYYPFYRFDNSRVNEYKTKWLPMVTGYIDTLLK